MTSFKSGDSCRLIVHEPWRSGGPRKVDAVVHLVNSDGKPLAVLLDGMIEGFARWLPLIWRGEQATTFQGTRVDIEAAL